MAWRYVFGDGPDMSEKLMVAVGLVLLVFVVLVAIELAGRGGWNPVLRASDMFTRTTATVAAEPA